MDCSTENFSGTCKDQGDASLAKDLFIPDDGNGIGDKDGMTTIKQQDVDMVGEQDMREENVPLVESKPLSEKQENLPKEHKKEESIEQHLVMKHEGQAGADKTGQSGKEIKLEDETKSQLVEDQPSSTDEDCNENPLLLNFVRSHYYSFPPPAEIEVEKIPPAEWVHKIRTIKNQENLRFAMESVNGSCPLVAVANVLALG